MMSTTKEAMASLDIFHQTLAEMMLEKGLLTVVERDNPDQGSSRLGEKGSNYTTTAGGR